MAQITNGGRTRTFAPSATTSSRHLCHRVLTCFGQAQSVLRRTFRTLTQSRPNSADPQRWLCTGLFAPQVFASPGSGLTNFARVEDPIVSGTLIDHLHCAGGRRSTGSSRNLCLWFRRLACPEREALRRQPLQRSLRRLLRHNLL
jgi:hypothetical protein